MEYSFAGASDTDTFRWFAEGLKEVMAEKGHTFTDDHDRAKLVVNFFPKDEPRPFRRSGQAVFVCSVSEFENPFVEPIPQGYPTLVRSLANLVVGLVNGGDSDPDAHFITPEQGHYVVSGNHDRRQYFERVYTRIHPLASSTLVINNLFQDDLPEELWQGDEITASLTRAGKKLAELDLLPAPFPMNELLPARDVKQLKRLFGIGGLSYGNLSARYDKDWFWMSASGVDKSNLQEIGRDILMVKDYDAEQVGMVVAHPPGVVPRRVSVDAIEHWMIYQEHPSVGAILHVHGWIKGVPSTEFNYPCGTRELGQAVADIVREADEPDRCVVGLKNHGLTITGRTLDEIFERIEGKVLPTVPMD
ncbi:MAG: class II aldolase/adducin family protein [Longimicrobiales bacterium]